MTEMDSTPSQPGPDQAPTPPPDAAVAAAAPAAAIAGRGVPTRWLIGGAVAIGSLAVAAIAFFLLSSRPIPEALRYVPADSVAVAEIRMDLPGDQLGHVGNLLAHFPGFKDQSTLGTKIDETLQRLVTNVTDGDVDYGAEVKPWLAGPAFVAMGGPGGATPGSSGSPGTVDVGGSRTLVVTTTDGKVACDAAMPDGPTTTETYAGKTLLISTGDHLACALDGRYGLVGDPERVRAAIDAHGAGHGIDTLTTYRTARDALGGDRLATLWTSGDVSGLVGMTDVLPSGAADVLKSLPAWTIAGLRAEDDALVVDVLVAPPPASSASAAVQTGRPTFAPFPPPRASVLAAFLPGDTLVMAEGHGVGVALQNGLLALRDDPAAASVAGQLDAALELAGGAQGLVGWIDDAGLVILPRTADGASGSSSETPPIDGGLVLVASDEATATAKATQLKTLLGLAALSSGGSAVDTVVDGTTITTIDLGDLGSLLQGAGGAGLPIPDDLHASFSIAVRGRLVIFGADETFARRLLQVQAGSTLADQAAYRHAISRASEKNLGQVFVAAAPLRQLAETMLPAEELQRWQTDIKPYAEPLEAVFLTTTLDGGLSRTRIVLTVATTANP